MKGNSECCVLTQRFKGGITETLRFLTSRGHFMTKHDNCYSLVMEREEKSAKLRSKLISIQIILYRACKLSKNRGSLSLTMLAYRVGTTMITSTRGNANLLQ